MKLRIEADLKSTMKRGDKPRLSALRLILSEIQRKEIDTRETLDDAGIISVLEKMAKQRREAIAQFENAGRTDLRDKEQFELETILSYLPPPLSEAELNALIEHAFAQSKATSLQDMGKVMAIIKAEAQGRADLSVVSRKIKEKLASSQ